MAKIHVIVVPRFFTFKFAKSWRKRRKTFVRVVGEYGHWFIFMKVERETNVSTRYNLFLNRCKLTLFKLKPSNDEEI